jgi:hypothetical protein
MQHWVERTFKLFEQDRTEHEIADELVAAGCEVTTADKLVVFVPLACGRVSLADTGVSLSASFRPMGSDGRVGEPQSLLADPVWIAVQEYVGAQSKANSHSVEILALRGSEFEAFRKARSKGSAPANLVFSDPLILLTEWNDAPMKKASWWQFWR